MKRDEEFGPVVLAPLADQPIGPSTVDITQAIRKGRQRRVGRRLATATTILATAGLAGAGIPMLVQQGDARPDQQLAVATTGAVAVTPSKVEAKATLDQPPLLQRQPVNLGPLPTLCTGSALPISRGVKESFAKGIDPTGRYAVGRHYPSGYNMPLLWDGDKAIRLNLNGNDDWMNAVNSHGVAVGMGYGFGGWAYVNGALQPVKGGAPEAINDAGVIAGGTDTRPLRWPSPSADPVELPLPAGVQKGMARGIDEDGTIVGLIGEAGNDAQAYLWTAEGNGFLLPAPAYQGQMLINVRAEAVSNGWVVGIGWLGEAMAVRWDLTTGKAEVFPSIEGGEDVNPAGWFSGKGSDGHAVMSDGLTVKALPDVFKFPSEYAWNVAYGISADGKVLAGTVVDGKLKGFNRAVRWTCH